MLFSTVCSLSSEGASANPPLRECSVFDGSVSLYPRGEISAPKLSSSPEKNYKFSKSAYIVVGNDNIVFACSIYL